MHERGNIKRGGRGGRKWREEGQMGKGDEIRERGKRGEEFGRDR